MFWVPLVVAGMDQARMSHQRACVEVSGLQANWVSAAFDSDEGSTQDQRMHVMG